MTAQPAALAGVEDWVGRRARAFDEVTESPIRRMAATLDRDDALASPGDPIPPGWHWLYFLSDERQSALGADGLGARDGLLPPSPLLRRMFTGAGFTFHQPIRVGERMERETEVASVSVKEGRGGPLVFITMRHHIRVPAGLTVTEDYHIVYRDAPRDGEVPAPGQPPPAEAAFSRIIRPDSVLLFRFSALTFNSHRIHYDHPYVTGVEGYPGLLVHGPLTVILLFDLLRREMPAAALSKISFRAMRPLYADADTDLTLAGVPAADGRSAQLWALDPTGAVAMSAEAEFSG